MKEHLDRSHRSRENIELLGREAKRTNRKIVIRMGEFQKVQPRPNPLHPGWEEFAISLELSLEDK